MSSDKKKGKKCEKIKSTYTVFRHTPKLYALFIFWLVWEKYEIYKNVLLYGPALAETLDSTFEGLGEMYEGHCADTRAGKFPLVLIRDQAEGLACADPGARTPIGASGNFTHL